MRGAHDVAALVLGGGYTALWVARALGDAGIRVLLAARQADFAARSRFVRSHVDGVEETPDGLVIAARRLGVQRAALLPCSDAWCEAVASLSGTARELLAASISPAEVVFALLDKATLAEAARAHGVPHPRTVAIESPRDLGVIETLEGPWILKPRHSEPFRRSFEHKGFLVQRRSDAEEHLATCTKAGQAMVLQEHVPGPPSAHVLIDGFVDRNGALQGWFARRRARKYPLELGDSTSGVYISQQEVEEPARRLLDFLLAIRCRGMFDAEFKLDPRDGIYKLLEVNCRPYGHVDFAGRTNLCLLSYHDALGLPPPAFRSPPLGASYVSVGREARALVEHYRRGDLSAGEVLVRLAKLPLAPSRRDDPLPALAHLVELAAKARSRRGQAKRARR